MAAAIAVLSLAAVAFATGESCSSIIVDAEAPGIPSRSPLDGTVSAWRAAGISESPGYSVSVARRNPDGTWTVTASESAVTPDEPDQSFTSNLPIKADEYVMLNLPAHGGIDILEGGSSETYFEPAMDPGETREPTGEAAQSFGTLALGATIEGQPSAR